MEYPRACAMVAQLFKHDQKKAQELLVRYCCENKNISDEIFCSIPPQDPLPHQSQPVGRGSFGSSVPPSLHEVHHPGPHFHQQEIPLRPSPGFPPTPARTARSEVSHSSKGDTDQKEFINLLWPVGNIVEKQPVRMKTAPITNSVIRHDLVPEELDANTVFRESGEVHIPQDADRGTIVAVPFFYIIKVAWHRPQSDKTHWTQFYVVSEEKLDVDIIMSYADSGVESPHPDVSPLHPETRHFQGYTSGLQHSGRTPPQASYHRSAETNNDSSRTISAHYQTRHNDQHFHTSVIPEAMNSASPAPSGPIENHHYPQRMSSNILLSSQPDQHEVPQPNPYRATVTTVASSNSVSETQPDVRRDKLRIAIQWDETRFNLWLYPDAPCQAFFEAFQKQAVKFKKSWDRTTTSILLKKDEEAPDDKSYEMVLDEDSLDADWKAVVKWLGKNMRNESPHVFGTVQVE